MTFTGACRITAIFFAVGSILAFAINVYFMFGIDDVAARMEFFRKAINKNGYSFLIGIILGTLAEISRAVQSRSV